MHLSLMIRKIEQMKWYKIKATMSTDLYAFVEAESQVKAVALALEGEPDAGDFVEEVNGGDWKIDNVYEVRSKDPKLGRWLSR